MTKCSAYKRDGSPCTATVEAPQEYCWWHDPANSEQRSKSASKAARAKAGELSEVKTKLRQLADDVLSGEVDRASGSVAAQILGVYLRAVELERKLRVTEEFEQRLATLEQAQERKGGGYGWAR